MQKEFEELERCADCGHYGGYEVVGIPAYDDSGARCYLCGESAKTRSLPSMLYLDGVTNEAPHFRFLICKNCIDHAYEELTLAYNSESYQGYVQRMSR